MKDASQYPITTGYGYIPGYPLNNGFHKGEDRAMPVGTPVLVNGVQIGLSGNTGASTGPHLHVGKFVGGAVQPPNGAAFSLNNASVFDTGYDSANGNFVRVTTNGELFVYLHLSRIDAKKGQILQGGNVSDIIDANLSRVIQHGILARNGLPGRAYALDGSTGTPWVGGPLTAAFIMDVFNSPEAVAWRDGSDPTSVKGITARLNTPPPTTDGFIPYAGPQLYQKKG